MNRARPIENRGKVAGYMVFCAASSLLLPNLRCDLDHTRSLKNWFPGSLRKPMNPTQQVKVHSTPESAGRLAPVGVNFADPIIKEFYFKIRDVYGTDKQFPYHNFDGHVLSVVAIANGIADRVEAGGTPVNRRVLILAALGHDALFGMDPAFCNCENSEQVAARYTRGVLEKLGLAQTEIDAVVHAIEATNYFVQPLTVEARILRAADLSSLAGPYEFFKRNTEALFAENLARGGSQQFSGFTDGSLRYLALYMADLISLTPNSTDSDGRSVWHTAAMRNIGELFREVFPTAPIQLRTGEAFEKREPSNAALQLVIELVNESELSQKESRLTKEAAFCSKDIIMKIPGTGSAIPLPDRFCDIISVVGVTIDEVPELARVCNPAGTILVRWNFSESLSEVVAAFKRFELNVVGGTTDEEGSVILFSRRNEPTNH